MYELDDGAEIILVDSNAYVPAVGMALGTSESIDKDGNYLKTISLVFIDPEDELHPILVHPNGELIQFLMSPEFKAHLAQLIEQTT